MNATLIRATNAEVLDSDPASVITLLADTGDTGGILTSNRSLLRDGTPGAPPHFHELSAELFFVLDGVLEVLAGDEVTTLSKGDLMVVPPRLPHAFAPKKGHDADVLVVFTPGKSRFDYYRLLDKVHRGEATWQEVNDSQELYDNYYVDSEAWRLTR